MKNQVTENPAKNRVNSIGVTHVAGQVKDMPLIVVAAFLITLYIASNVMAVRVISIGDLALFDAGTITFPAAYMLGDVLTEIWGFKTTRKIIFITFLCNILFVLCTALGGLMPYPDYMQETVNAYGVIFGYVPRIVIASLLGFLCGELANAKFMELIKAKTGEKHLWMRTIGSSMVGYIFDTVLFVIAAFGGTAPAWDLFTMIAIQYVAKLLIEALSGTPLAYAAIYKLKKYYNKAENKTELKN